MNDMKRLNLTNKHMPEPLTEMVKALMAGPNAQRSFAQQAQEFMGAGADVVLETQISVTANRLNQPRWWKQFVGDQITEEQAGKVKSLLESDSYGPVDQTKVKELAGKLKSLLNQNRRAASALTILVACAGDKGTRSEPGEVHFHLGRLAQDLDEDLALAEDLCEAVVQVTDLRVSTNTYRFLVEQALGLLTGVEVVAVLADRFHEVTGAATGQ